MIEIRSASSHDAEAWLPLWHGYLAFYKADVSDATTQVTWGRILDASEPVFAALAWDGGRAVGLVHWIVHRSMWTVGDYCYLQDLFVAPETRGGGIGRKLIEHVYAAALAKQCSRVYWLTHETNRDAMLLYDRIADRSGFLQYRKILG